MACRLNYGMIQKLEQNMKEDEKSKATIEKYCRDVKAFIRYVGEGTCVTKEAVIAYKDYLGENYELTSANSMLAAVNYFLRFLGRRNCIVKAFKVQKEAFRSQERELTKEEYGRLLEAALSNGDQRLYLIMLTICTTGIRISELPFITFSSLHSHRTRVCLKGKSRTVILPRELCNKLKDYCKKRGITSGSLFVTRSGKPVDRSNIFHAMKKLCKKAGVEETKVFPHNLRHLFAVTFYKAERDICRLADLLGHSNINTTRIYTLISCEEQERQLESLCLCW